MARRNQSKTQARYLGKTINKAVTTLDRIPWERTGEVTRVTLHCSEFTSHCPVTKQPDFATLEIQYVPNRFLVETKSLKLYLWTFRNKKEFNEKLVRKIAQDFYQQIRPTMVEVKGRFHARGGISVEVYHRI